MKDDRMADVLIIDDDPDCAQILAEILEAEGHQARIGYNGEDGLRQVEERLPELVLLDVEMPIVSGPEMALQMLIIDCGQDEIPVVFLSGVSNLDEIAGSIGTPYFLGKPYRYEELAALIDLALAERIPPQPPVALV